jgi:hypothetical protein
MPWDPTVVWEYGQSTWPHSLHASSVVLANHCFESSDFSTHLLDSAVFFPHTVYQYHISLSTHYASKLYLPVMHWFYWYWLMLVVNGVPERHWIWSLSFWLETFSIHDGWLSAWQSCQLSAVNRQGVATGQYAGETAHASPTHLPMCRDLMAR